VDYTGLQFRLAEFAKQEELKFFFLPLSEIGMGTNTRVEKNSGSSRSLFVIVFLLKDL